MIKAINENQLDDFLKIRRDSLLLDPPAFGADPNPQMDREKTRRDLQAKNEENFILFYYQQQQVAGMLGLMRFTKVKVRHKAYIWGVFVYPQFRGQGIARQLMEEAIARARKIVGLEKINLGASHTSDAALALYEGLGFKAYGRERRAMKWEGEWIDEVLFDLLL